MKIGEESMRGPDAPPVPTGLRLIVIDLSEHPDSSIGEIAARTGLPQSHVSQSVARLQARGAVETASDPRDGRRTLVRLSPGVPARASRLGSVSVDHVLSEAMGITDSRGAELVDALKSVLAHLRESDGEEERVGRTAHKAGSRWPLEADA